MLSKAISLPISGSSQLKMGVLTLLKHGITRYYGFRRTLPSRVGGGGDFYIGTAGNYRLWILTEFGGSHDL